MNGNRQQSITFIHLFPLTFLNLHFLPFLKGQQNLSSGPVSRQDKTPPRSQVIAFKNMPGQQDDDNPPPAFYGKN